MTKKKEEHGWVLSKEQHWELVKKPKPPKPPKPPKKANK
jgi:hypothetical protein